MEDQGQKNGRMVNVEVSDGIDRSELFGGLDKNLRLIEENLKVDIIQRDDSLILKGEYASRAEKIIKEMMSVLEKGGKLDEQKINYIADLSDRGISYREENPGKDIICFTHEGKPLRAKTIGQKTYVDSIRKKDIVFGIGPAGTGKTYIAKKKGYSVRDRACGNGQDLHRSSDGSECFQEQTGAEDNTRKTGCRSRRETRIPAGGPAGKGGSVSQTAVRRSLRCARQGKRA